LDRIPVIVVVKEPADLDRVMEASRSLGLIPVPGAKLPRMFKGTITKDKMDALAGIEGVLSVEQERVNRTQ
jgi:hypothetical protein